MATKRFLTSVADVFGYDENDNLLFTSKTLLDSSIEVTLGSTEVRGGRGNQLLYVYYHSNAMNVTLNDTQWNLQMLGATVGETIATGSDIYTEETITLGASGGGTVTGTPLAIQGATIYGWVTLPDDGGVEKVVFTGQNFTLGIAVENDVVCVRYYHLNSAARSLSIPAEILPKIVRVEMEALLISSQETTNRIGIVSIIVPTAQLTGNFSLAMTADGVSSTPLTLRALANPDLQSAACSNVPVLAKIIEVLDNVNWYDNVIALSISGGDIGLTHPTTRQLVVYAIPQTGAAFAVPLTGTNITFASSTVGAATVSANGGLITTVAAGTTTIKATITGKNSIDANIIVTVS